MAIPATLGGAERRLRWPLYNPVDAGVADVQLGGNVPGGHAASRQRPNFVPVQHQPFSSKVRRAALRLEFGVSGGCTFTSANGFLFRQDCQQRDYDLTEHPGAVDVLLSEALPLHAVIGQFTKML